MGKAIHVVGKPYPVPMNCRFLRQVVGELDAQTIANPDPQGWTGHLAVTGPYFDLGAVDESTSVSDASIANSLSCPVEAEAFGYAPSNSFSCTICGVVGRHPAKVKAQTTRVAFETKFSAAINP